MTTLYESSGPLRYSQGNFGYRLVVDVDKELAEYYRSLIPKWISTNKQMYPPHITVVRCYKELPVNLKPWGKYEGEIINFQYENIVHSGKVYFWLNVFCKRLEVVRAELGLPVTSEYTRPPEGYLKCFHCTIGNIK